MSFSKVLASSALGSVSITEDKGIAIISADAQVEPISGIKVKAGAEIEVTAVALIDAGFALAEAKFPSVAPYLKMAQAAIDAEVAKA